MKNGDKALYPYNKNCSLCSICNSTRLIINRALIRNIKLIKILSKIDEDELINKCKCLDGESVVHRICLLFNIIYNFEVKCRRCKNFYNISVDKSLNNSNKLCKIFSYLCMTLFHIILLAVSVILIIYIFVIKKEAKDNLESKKYGHISIFFGIVIFIINSLLIYIAYNCFIDKNEIDVYEYIINVNDEKEENKFIKNLEKSCFLLNDFYRYFHNTKIKYLIQKCHKSVFFDSGYGYFNMEIKRIIQENNKDYNNSKEEISDLNKEQNNKKIEIKDFHYTGTLGIKKSNEKNNGDNSFEKNSKNTNPINLQLSLIKKDNDEYINNKDNMDDILIINKNLTNKKELSERNKFDIISIYSNKKFNIFSKSCFYKKINPNKMFSKSRTYKTKSDRKKENRQNNIKDINIIIKRNSKKIIKLNESSRKYRDSTSLLRDENEKDKNKNT